MPRQRRRRAAETASTESGVQGYRYTDKRLNIPPAGLVSYETVRETRRQRYAYDAYLSPQLVRAGKLELKSELQPPGPSASAPDYEASRAPEARYRTLILVGVLDAHRRGRISGTRVDRLCKTTPFA